MTRVLVVEDHFAIANGLRDNLEAEGYEARVARDGIEGVTQAEAWKPDLLILDLMLPRRDGFSVLATVRSRGATMPILVLSARGGESEKVRALSGGADDYMVKPFGLLELLARIQALLRRVGPDRTRSELSEGYRIGPLEVRVTERTVSREGHPVILRPKELDLLIALCRARGGVVARGNLLLRVWGYDAGVFTRTVDTHVAALRARIEADPNRPDIVLTVRKVGYRIGPPCEPVR